MGLHKHIYPCMHAHRCKHTGKHTHPTIMHAHRCKHRGKHTHPTIIGPSISTRYADAR